MKLLSETSVQRQRRYWRTWYYRNQKKVYALVVQRRQQRVEWYQELKNSLACSRCSENHPACLTFHHRDRQDKYRAVSEMIQRLWSKKRILEEISKCDVLCANCHAKLHWEERR